MLDRKWRGDRTWVSPSERLWLVRLCATLTEQTTAAEDLAQETLLEAWRNRHKLHDGVEQRAWLSGVARRVCLRWRRRTWQEQSRVQPLPISLDAPKSELFVLQNFDFEMALSHTELTDMLDRALALLTPETRTLLVQQYVDEIPRSEIAARLGIAEGAVAVRLYRGKLALRRVFENDLRDEAAEFHLLPSNSGEKKWKSTYLWCPLCGRDRLSGHFNSNTGSLVLGCSRCSNSRPYIQADDSRLLHGIKGCRPALQYLLSWSHHYFLAAAQTGITHCYSCSKIIPASRIKVRCLPNWSGPAVQLDCSSCKATCTGVISLIFYPEVLKFWQQHPRMRVADQQPILFSGRPALLTRFESVTDAAQIELVQAADKLELLQVKQN